ncbi:MAG: hypothetical protein H6Q84_308 [Deltaproteobacteria bacterium]|nr:hypothetical protein [Deltaproteobacteria bacterium]
MDKYLSCWNVTGKCYFVVRKDSEEEVLERFSEHLKIVHGIQLTEELREKAISVLRKAA